MSRPFLLCAAALPLAACERAETPVPAEPAAAPAQQAAATPVEQARALVMARLDGGRAQANFREDRVYAHDGATVVCGTLIPAAAGAQRYIAVLESQEVFFEGAMEPGAMAAAEREFCRNP